MQIMLATDWVDGFRFRIGGFMKTYIDLQAENV